MPITATNNLHLALQHLANTIDASEMFRAWMESPNLSWEDLADLADAGTSPSAEGLIYRGIVAGEPEPPSCWVLWENNSTLERSSTSGIEFNGSLRFSFCGHAPDVYRETGDIAEAQKYWWEVVSRIMQEMGAAVISAPAGKIDMSTVQFDEPSVLEPDQHQDGQWWLWSTWVVGMQQGTFL